MEALLLCMERHQSSASVQAMACWSMVNLALISSQKRSLVHQGAVLAVVRAMALHAEDKEVHFRAMFALINLVTPDVTVEKSIQPETMKVGLQHTGTCTCCQILTRYIRGEGGTANVTLLSDDETRIIARL